MKPLSDHQRQKNLKEVQGMVNRMRGSTVERIFSALGYGLGSLSQFQLTQGGRLELRDGL